MDNIKVSTVLRDVSLSLSGGLFVLFLLSSAGFVFGIGINAFYVPLSVAAGLSAPYFFRLSNLKETVLSSVVVLGVVFLSLWMSLAFTDSSFDGPWYHQTAALFLKKGWNPVYERAADFLTAHWDFRIRGLPYIDSYPKFTEIIAANVFYTTGDIEAGKIFNPLFSAILFCYSVYVLTTCFPDVDSVFSVVLSLLLTLNPVVLAQMPTYYPDGTLYAAFMLILLSLIELQKTKGASGAARLMLVTATTALTGVKLTGLLYAAEIFAFRMIYLKLRGESLKPFFPFLCLCGFLFVLTGVNPYITNLIQGKHVFYPIAGSEKIDFLTPQTPSFFINRSMPYKLFVSVFHRADDAYEADRPVLKLPFTQPDKYYERGKMQLPDTRLGGFGLWWSGILLCSLALLPPAWKRREGSEGMNRFVLTVLAATVLSNPVNWWTRYVPQFYALPVFILLFTACERGKLRRFYIPTMLFLFLINSALTLEPVFEKAAATGNRVIRTGEERGTAFLPDSEFVPPEEKTASVLLQTERR